MFKPRFAELVEAGTKLQTVRPYPKRMPKAGQLISLRAWSGKPYRSKQRHLRTSTITFVGNFAIDRCGITVQNFEGDPNLFARLDGFTDLAEMVKWFEAEHGLPFSGIVIRWT